MDELTLLRNLRASYIPITIYRPNDRTEGIQVLDWLSAKYQTLRDEVLQFDYFTITDSEVGQPDLIAYIHYQDETLWWIICLYNQIIDPQTELVTGKRLKIPNLQSTELFLARKLSPSSASENKNQFVTI
jgi:hypothetical protein